MQTKKVIGNLLNRYRAVLKKCHLLNTFGTLALASAFILGGAASAMSGVVQDTFNNKTQSLTGVTVSEYLGIIGFSPKITDTTFKEASLKQGEHIYNAGGKEHDKAAYGGGVVYFCQAPGVTTITNSSFNGNTVENDSLDATAGAFFDKGTTIDLNNVAFTGNKAAVKSADAMAWGGAIYADAAINDEVGVKEAILNFNVTKDMTYSGNTIEVQNTSTWVDGYDAISKSSGGFLVLDRNSTANFNVSDGATLTIGAEDASGHMDSIASSLAIDEASKVKSSTLVKKGGGTLTVNSQLNDFYGHVAVQEGTMNVTKDWDVKNDISVSGGTLNLANASLVKVPDIEYIGTDGKTKKTLTSDKTPAGRINISGGTVNADSLTVGEKSSVDMTGGELNMKNSLTLNGAMTLSGGAAATVAMPDKGGVSAGSGESLIALGQPITLGNSAKLHVGTVSGDATAAFGSDSILVVNGGVSSQNAMINGSGNLSVGDGAQLYVTDAKANTKYIITKGLSQDSYWSNANLMANRLIKGTVSEEGDQVVVTTEVQDVSQALPGVIPATALTTMLSQNLNNTESDAMGVRFLSRAIEPLYMPDDKTAVRTINEVSRAAVMAGVQNTALRLSNAASDTVLHHMSLGNFDSGNSVHKDGTDVWATPMYGNIYTHGMNVSDDSVVGNYGGLAIGADTEIGSFGGGMLRMGLAVHGGAGRSESQGAVTSTDDNYNFGGANLYAGWNRDSLNILASVGYSISSHSLNMDLPSSLGMGDADADVQTGAFTAELCGEYQFRTDWLDIMPHTGVRYTSLHTYGYDLEVDDRTLNSVDDDFLNIVQFPTGVTLTKNIAAGGWNIKPQFDASIIPAVGDTKTKTRVTYSGIDAEDSIRNTITDTVSWSGMAGLQFEKGDFTVGVNYNIQASTHETDQNVSLNLVYKF